MKYKRIKYTDGRESYSVSDGNATVFVSLPGATVSSIEDFGDKPPQKVRRMQLAVEEAFKRKRDSGTMTKEFKDEPKNSKKKK